MCGRFTLRSPRRIKFDGERNSHLPSLAPRYNIAPSQEVLTITESHRRRELSSFCLGTHGRSKQPYYFQLKDEAPFAFAGLWDRWQHEDVSIISCSIITIRPNELLATIHDRMPAILPPESQDAWLRNYTEPAELKRLLIPFPASAMKSYPVSQQVNHALAEDAQLVEPIELNQVGTNLTLF